MADQPTFTSAQLADPVFFAANRADIFRALREGRIDARLAYQIGNGRPEAQAVQDGLGATISDDRTTGPSADQPPAGDPAKATSAEAVDIAANLRRAFGLG